MIIKITNAYNRHIDIQNGSVCKYNTHIHNILPVILVKQISLLMQKNIVNHHLGEYIYNVW